MNTGAIGSVVKYIVISLLIFVLTANLAIFIFSQDGYVGNEFYKPNEYLYGYFVNTRAHYEYRGFADFFNFMRTFPGLNISLNALNEFVLIMSFKMPVHNVLDVVAGILKVISLPVNLMISFVADIVNIFRWVFGYLIPWWIF